MFEWQETRRHACLAELIGADYKGILQADGYEAYPAYAREHEGVTWVACWAHARRKFYEAREEAPAQADFVLELMGGLYADERRWDEAEMKAPERAALRKAEWTPRLNWLKRGAFGLRQDVLKKSRLGLACQYLLNQWDALVPHLADGRTRIDNNSAEKTIRPAKLGMKNWLFIGPPPRRPALGDPPLAGHLLQTPRQGPARLPARRAHPPAEDDQPGRSARGG